MNACILIPAADPMRMIDPAGLYPRVGDDDVETAKFAHRPVEAELERVEVFISIPAEHLV